MHALLNKSGLSFLLIALLAMSSFSVSPLKAHAAKSDVGLVYSSFSFSKLPLITGQVVRFYASVKNTGDTDIQGEVAFSLPSGMIKQPSAFTSVAHGGFEDVWVDFTVPEDPFNLYVQLFATGDSDASNNTYFSPQYTPLEDRDRDGIADNVDNCPGKENANQADVNKNGVGDACEPIVVPDPTPAPSPTPTPIVPPAPVPVVAPSKPTAVPNPITKVVQQVEQEVSAALTPDEVIPAVTTEVLGKSPAGNLTLSPNARLTYERVGWNVYDFKAYRPVDGAVYAWEVSDGRTQSGPQATLHFPQPGLYTVKLITSVKDGTFVSEDVIIHVSFFHLQNPWLASLIAGLLVLCGVILWQSVRNRKQPVE